MSAGKTLPVVVRVVDDIRGRWHDDTWYRRGQTYLCVPTAPPLTPGWRPLDIDHTGTIAATHAEVIGHVN